MPTSGVTGDAGHSPPSTTARWRRQPPRGQNHCRRAATRQAPGKGNGGV